MKEISPWRIQRTVENENGKSGYIDAEYSNILESEEPHLRDYWKILVNRRRLVVLVFLMVFGFGAYIISSATPMYTASTTILIEPRNPVVMKIQEVLSLQSGGSTYDYYRTQFALLESRRLAAKVITKLGLESNRAFTSIRVISPNPLKWLSSWIYGPFQSFLTYTSQLIGPESKHKEKAPPISQEKTPLIIPLSIISERFRNF